MSLTSLSNDVMDHVCSYLDIQDIYCLGLTSKNFKENVQLDWKNEYVKLSRDMTKKPRLIAKMDNKLKCMALLREKLLQKYEYTSFEQSIHNSAKKERNYLDTKLKRLHAFNPPKYEEFLNGEYKQRSDMIGYMLQPLKDKQRKINKMISAFGELENYKAEQMRLKEEKRKQKEDAFLGFISSDHYVHAVENGEMEGFVSLDTVNIHFEKYCKELNLRCKSIRDLIHYGPCITIFRPIEHSKALEREKKKMDDEGYGWHYKLGLSSCYDENGKRESVMVTCNLNWRYVNHAQNVMMLGFSASH